MKLKSSAIWWSSVGSFAAYEKTLALEIAPEADTMTWPGTSVYILIPRVGPSKVGTSVFVIPSRL